MSEVTIQAAQRVAMLLAASIKTVMLYPLAHPSVGQPLAGTRVAIRDAAGGDAGVGVEGEIVVSGPSVMRGYFRAPEATEATLARGWLRTGDLGVVQGGSLYVTGREKDLVIKAGRKFHPYEIERIVAEVVDAPPGGVAAFSQDNDETGTEDLVIVIERRRGHDADEDPTRKVRGRLMEELGVRADRVCVVAAGELPRTTSGKVRRRACAALFPRPPTAAPVAAS